MGLFSIFQSGKKRRAAITSMLERGALVLDVRTTQEFAQGHVEGSINIPLNHLQAELPKLKEKGKPIIVCCASGIRSKIANTQLKAKGLESINGGAWTTVKNSLS